MFQDAVGRAEVFTQPVITSTLRRSGQVSTSLASFVIVNDAGWAVTAAHVMATEFEAGRSQKAIDAWKAQVDAIKADASLTSARRKSLLGRVPNDPTWIEKHSYWWGYDGATAGQVIVDQLADLAFVQLAGYPTNGITEFPVFGNPASHIRPGGSLCRLGFPFNELESSWDAGAGQFKLKPGTLPVTRFALDGMYARMLVVEEQASGRRVSFIETSTPGLRGQSGGPIFDFAGTVWAIQSQTMHLELGFHPTVTVGGKRSTEHQFLNAGLGSDVAEIVRMAQDNGISLNIHP